MTPRLRGIARANRNLLQPIRAPRGTALSCRGWHQEAALRMLMNTLDPAVAENPEQLIVSGGIGKLARDWPAFHAIVESLQHLGDDETLLVCSGEPGPILKTNSAAPRVLIVNSAPRPAPRQPHPGEIDLAIPAQPKRMAANWMFTGPASALPQTYETFRAAARRHFGGTLAGRLVVAGGMGGMGGAQALAATLNGAAFLGIDADAGRIKRRLKTNYCEVMVNSLDEALRILKNAVRKREPASVGLIANTSDLMPELARRGVLPDLLTDETPADDIFAYIPGGLTVEQAAQLRAQDPRVYRERALDSMATQVRAMLELKKMGAIVFEFGNRIRAQALAHGVTHANEIPDFASEYLLPDFQQGLLTVAALSGDPDDLAPVDALFPALFAQSDLPQWIAIARRHRSPGVPARSCWIGAGEAIQLATAINDAVARGEIKAPVAIGRSVRSARGMGMPHSQPAAQAVDSAASSQALANWPGLPALLEAAAGTSWVGFEAMSAGDEGWEQAMSFAVVADGKLQTAERIGRVFAHDFLASAFSLAPPTHLG